MPTRKLSQIIRQLDTETEVSAKVKEIFEQEDVMARMIRFHIGFLERFEGDGDADPLAMRQAIEDARESAKELRAIAREFLPTRSREAEIGQTASAKAELLLELTDEELQEALESDNRKILELRQRTKTA
jgi:hypothetical protein